MSQREGAPRTGLSSLCLRLVAWLTCRDAPNEWQTFWAERATLHHDCSPRGEGAYTGHSCRRFADMVQGARAREAVQEGRGGRREARAQRGTRGDGLGVVAWA